ncbi:LPXTG cell wall anchor domain-containing protein [Lacticaseibacillus manihotivorans]|nr:LPXTG cell wall anchor domain-containing protein [Lacticaseibacillus manihotivorans]
MPTTGDAVNEGAVVAGVATAMLALFGLAETKKRRA